MCIMYYVCQPSGRTACEIEPGAFGLRIAETVPHATPHGNARLVARPRSAVIFVVGLDLSSVTYVCGLRRQGTGLKVEIFEGVLHWSLADTVLKLDFECFALEISRHQSFLNSDLSLACMITENSPLKLETPWPRCVLRWTGPKKGLRILCFAQRICDWPPVRTCEDMEP